MCASILSAGYFDSVSNLPTYRIVCPSLEPVRRDPSLERETAAVPALVGDESASTVTSEIQPCGTARGAGPRRHYPTVAIRTKAARNSQGFAGCLGGGRQLPTSGLGLQQQAPFETQQGPRKLSRAREPTESVERAARHRRQSNRVVRPRGDGECFDGAHAWSGTSARYLREIRGSSPSAR